jgi:LAS superfamily LD-carboxypeptidase LdcB
MKRYLLLSVLFIATAFKAGKGPDEYRKADLLGDVEAHHNRDFDKLKSKYTTKANAYLRDEVYDAFKKMWKAAKKDGIKLTIISATRNRSYQSGIWNRKWNSFGGEENDRAERILQYSSMPGTSRHHWGTDFDLNSLENSYFESGEGLRVYEWLTAHAHTYGFFQPYTKFNDYRDAGYREEKWHWSYYPLASKFQRAYTHMVEYPDLKGFNGSEYAQKLDVINNYVNGIEVDQKVER